MTRADDGTVVITGPTSGLGRPLALEMTGCAGPHRADVLGIPTTAIEEIHALRVQDSERTQQLG